MIGAPLPSNQTVQIGSGDLEMFQTALRSTSAPLMARASRQVGSPPACGAFRAVAADCTTESESSTASDSSCILP